MTLFIIVFCIPKSRAMRFVSNRSMQWTSGSFRRSCDRKTGVSTPERSRGDRLFILLLSNTLSSEGTRMLSWRFILPCGILYPPFLIFSFTSSFGKVEAQKCVLFNPESLPFLYSDQTKFPTWWARTGECLSKETTLVRFKMIWLSFLWWLPQ